MKPAHLSLVAAAVAVAALFPASPAGATAADWYVAPGGSDAAAGTSAAPFATVQHALDVAGPGSTVHLASGHYAQDAVTRYTDVTVTGPTDAVLTGGGSSHVFQINHHQTTLTGFTIDGTNGGNYRNKLIYADGADDLTITNMHLTNAGGECVHLIDSSQNSEVGDNHITGCGRYGPDPDTGYINGEGIYVGSALSHQQSLGITDASNGNWIHGNAIDTDGGSECVDIKEHSTGNIVENNTCTGVAEAGSGAIDLHGNGNIIRKNTVDTNLSAGVRLGGTAEPDGTPNGTGNDVYLNTITGNDAGGIKFLVAPQGKVCGNTMSGNAAGNAVGSYADQFDPTAACPSRAVRHG
ncbi:hypothetical protein Athai_61420 [Actinocatenispora thailandica]|uniref:DUF1565 domain-containing protein n=1 Tax=Actinocatenispora thailandica TaxID=227318 RepID=A0A7R7DVI2_9ACTN|nr:right-handed parallel beta-helix repeat-containing protein [Actinocatenispora thailandica]BCJ38639.1 hypothetical protein Athai_61420 [Actinocatenispora thailandica]